MASRHHSLDLTECREVIATVTAFEEHCNVKVAIGLSVLPKGKVPELWVTACAFPCDQDVVEAAPLACVSLHSSSTNLRAIKDVVTHVLYMLDGKLAWLEMQGNPDHRA